MSNPPTTDFRALAELLWSGQADLVHEHGVVLLVVAAVTSDASQAGGLDDAFDTLHGLFLGPVLVGLVGAGFVAYGLFLFFRARYARL